MRNATSISLFGASTLAIAVLGACGGGGSDGTRDMTTTGGTSSTAGTTTIIPSAGTTSSTGGTSASTGSTSSTGGASGGAPACNPMPGPKKGDGTNMVIDDMDDTNTTFMSAGVGMGSWDFSKDASTGTITPANTMALMPVTGGQMGSALHVSGMALTGWGASLAAFLNGATGSFDASAYGGVAFYIKGTTNVQEGMNKLMMQARMPDVLPGPGSCCIDTVPGSECYSGHRVVIDVPANWTEVKIAWSDFKGPTWGLGSTLAFNPNRIRDINFSFNHDTMSKDPTGSSFDVWVDGLRFMSMTEMSNVTSTTGTGGTSSGGSGGAAAGTGGAAAGTGGSQ